MHALLFSEDREDREEGLQRCEMWTHRGKVPSAVEATVVVLAAQLEDQRLSISSAVATWSDASRLKWRSFRVGTAPSLYYDDSSSSSAASDDLAREAHSDCSGRERTLVCECVGPTCTVDDSHKMHG